MKPMECQRISAEILVGLFLSTVYRICASILYLQDATYRVAAVQCDVTRSVCCVWLASNMKFLLFKSKNDRPSLSVHCISRLVAFLALLLNAFLSGRPSGEQLPILDLAVCSFFIVSSVAHLVLDWSQVQGSVDISKAVPDPKQLFLQMDAFATFIFGLLWLAYPDWLLPSENYMGSQKALNLHLTQAFGAMMVGESCVSFITQTFHSSRDSTSVFVRRTFGTVALLMFLVHSQWTMSAWTTARVCFGTVGAGLWTGNSILGCLSAKNIV